MQYYYSLFGMAVVLGLFAANPRIQLAINNHVIGYEKTKKIYLLIVFVDVFLLIGLRGYRVGADTVGYIEAYYYGVLDGGIFFDDSPEIVLNIIAWLSQLFSKDYQLFFIFHAIIVSVLFYKYICDNSCDVFLSTIIFLGMFFVPSMNLMREWLAIGFGINSLTAFKEKKKWLGWVLLVLAFLTHMTAICLLAIVVFEGIKNKKKAFWVIILFSSLFYCFRNQLLGFVTILVPKYYDYVYHVYFVGEGGFNIKDLIFITIESYYFYVLLFRRKDADEIQLSGYYQNAAFLFLAIIFSLSGQKFEIIHRLVYYYSVSLVVSLPEMIKKSKIKVPISVLLVVCMFVMLYRNSFWDNNLISHYTFFWQ